MSGTDEIGLRYNSPKSALWLNLLTHIHWPLDHGSDILSFERNGNPDSNIVSARSAPSLVRGRSFTPWAFYANYFWNDWIFAGKNSQKNRKCDPTLIQSLVPIPPVSWKMTWYNTFVIYNLTLCIMSTVSIYDWHPGKPCVQESDILFLTVWYIWQWMAYFIPPTAHSQRTDESKLLTFNCASNAKAMVHSLRTHRRIIYMCWIHNKLFCIKEPVKCINYYFSF